MYVTELPVRQCAALGSLLDGSAACSASLTVLDIKEAFWLNEFGFMVMASAMSGKPKGESAAWGQSLAVPGQRR